ncbi:MAG: sensor histidine kinase [Syntrophales bacterium]
MDNNGLYEKLNELFLGDIMARIIPGAIHNLANPLGGIMGRVQLMKARVAKSFKSIESLHPELYRELRLDRIKNDVVILSGESEMMLSIFRNFEGKILALSARGQEKLDISKLIEAEMKFADFYLDFKHDVNKSMTFKDNVPEIYGERAGYSLCLSALINSARQRMANMPEKELTVAVDYDDVEIRIVFQDSGEEIASTYYKRSGGEGVMPDIKAFPVAEHGLFYAFMLLKSYGFQIEVVARSGRNIISLRLPYKII